MASSFRVYHLVTAVNACLFTAMLASCQSVKSNCVTTRPAQRSEVIYTGSAPQPHAFAFEARPPGLPRVPTPEGPGMECLHLLSTSLTIAGRIPLAVGAGVIGFGGSGYSAKAGVGVAGWVMDQPLQ
jgi:hypothetical protein